MVHKYALLDFSHSLNGIKWEGKLSYLSENLISRRVKFLSNINYIHQTKAKSFIMFFPLPVHGKKLTCSENLKHLP